MTAALDTATLAGGCFWCVEAVFDDLKGVQGTDSGTQYRSAIFSHSEAQKNTAQEIIAEVTREGLYRNPIVTEVTAASTFYLAEQYHQEYFARNPNQQYCMFVVAPKVAKFRKKYAERLKK